MSGIFWLHFHTVGGAVHCAANVNSQQYFTITLKSQLSEIEV